MGLQLQILKEVVTKQNNQMQDLITQKYQFTIIPLQIITKSLSLVQTSKSILIKLGQSTAKTSDLKTPLKFIVQVLYSKTKKKYCPIKGIIKIYDILEDENQIICCVGTFQTQDILQQKITKQIITKNIGSTTLKMEVSAKLYIQQSKLGIEPQLMKQSISQVSSQRMIRNSDGSHHLISLQDSITEQSDQIRQLRRVNTLNPGQTYQTSDVIDLKSAINFGPSRSIHNSTSSGYGLASSHNKLQMKANILQKNNLRQQHQSVRDSENRNSSPPTTNNPLTMKNLYSIPRINAKSSLDEFYKQQDNDENSQVMSGIDLQLQSKKSRQMIIAQNKQLRAPPELSLPLFLGLTLSREHYANEPQNCHMKVGEFANENNDDNRASPLMMGSAKHINIENSRGGQVINPNSHLSASKYSIGSVNSNENAGALVKGIYNLAFIPKVQSSREIMLSSTVIDNNPNNPNSNKNNNMDLSMSNASLTTSVMNEYQKMEIETLGEQLIEERRKNLEYERKIEKYHFKIIASRQKYYALLHQWDEWCYYGHKFLEHLTKDVNGQHLIEISRKKQNITMKYNVNNQSETIFMNFLRLTIENTSTYHKSESQHRLKTENSQFSQRKTRLASEISQISSPQINQVLQKIESTYASNSKLLKIQQQLNEQIHSVSQNLSRVQKSLRQSQTQKMRLLEEMAEQEKNIEHLNFQINSISGINSYLKQKDQQMQNIISLKQTTIDNMKKIMQENNVELDELEEEISQCKKAADNKELMLEEMREELADKEEIIQLYRQVYGEINRYSRNKDADLQIQSCIRTIIENNRIDANHNDACNNIEAIDEDLNEEITSQIMSNNDNRVEDDSNRVVSRTNTKNKNRKSLSIGESVSLANSIGISRESISRNSLGIKEEKDSKDDKISYQRSLLLSIIRNNERIYRVKPEEVKTIHAELKNIYNKIDDYIKKLEAPNLLFHSMK